MDLSSWLNSEKGRSAALAAHFQKTPAAISQWKKNGVPLDLMKAVVLFTGGAVTLHELVPEPKEQVRAEANNKSRSRRDGPSRHSERSR